MKTSMILIGASTVILPAFALGKPGERATHTVISGKYRLLRLLGEGGAGRRS